MQLNTMVGRQRSGVLSARGDELIAHVTLLRGGAAFQKTRTAAADESKGASVKMRKDRLLCPCCNEVIGPESAVACMYHPRVSCTSDGVPRIRLKFRLEMRLKFATHLSFIMLLIQNGPLPYMLTAHRDRSPRSIELSPFPQQLPPVNSALLKRFKHVANATR